MPNDVEGILLAKLLKSSGEEARQFWSLRDIDETYFNTRLKEYLFLKKFWEQYKSVPSIEAFGREFPDFVPAPVKEPILYWVNEIVKRRQWNHFAELFNRVRPILVAGERDRLPEVEAIVQEFSGRIPKLSHANGTDWRAGARDRFMRYLDRRDTDPRTLLQTPWPTINEIIYCVEPGDFVIISGRSSLGKTWIAQRWAYYCWERGFKVVLNSKEMARSHMEGRFDCIGARISWDKYRRGQLSPEQEGRLLSYLKSLKGREPLPIVDDDGLANSSTSALEAVIEEYRPDVLFVDGTEFFKEAGKVGLVENTVDAARGLKRIAKSRKIPIICTVQLNRKSENTSGDTKASAANLAWSDEFLKVADILFGLSGRRDDDLRTMTILKGRNSSLGVVGIKFVLDPETAIEELNSEDRVERKINDVIAE